MSREEAIGTRVVRTARVLPSGAGGPVVPPLVQSVAFHHGSAEEQDAVFANERPGFVYGRYGTPTTAALESALAELEGTAAAVCFTSGMAAIHALVTACALPGGGRLVAQEDPYGQTRALFERFAREQGADVAFVDPCDHAAVAAALAERPTRLLFVEAISNPLLRVVDVAALARIAHEGGATLAVDATFATPVLLRPAALGADAVVHSLTKYLNGHGDVMGGVVAGSDELGAAMRERAMLDGAYLPPHEAWLTIRGMRTLALRVDRQCANALALAGHLRAHPKVARVHYPGLRDHPHHELARRQLGGRFGGVLAFALREDSRAAAFRFLDALELVGRAATLGDVFSEVLYPAISSHRRLAPEERARLGITEGFLRISCGIEDPADIAADLDAALERV
ncbi:MAG TPA: PLP-dependent aspartate aminotransferase family protein [Candidatus Limnocylindrales bacterium]|nr:PLP-dependent aspartate aminotransferase family protein [Candidatus Limnocylindrales bacterium]